jgi:hypothetical protein
MRRSQPLMQFTHPPALAWQRLPDMEDCPVSWCGLCRRCNPPLFDVPDDVWLHYVGPEQRDQVVCIRCWRRLTVAITAVYTRTRMAVRCRCGRPRGGCGAELR